MRNKATHSTMHYKPSAAREAYRSLNWHHSVCRVACSVIVSCNSFDGLRTVLRLRGRKWALPKEAKWGHLLEAWRSNPTPGSFVTVWNMRYFFQFSVLLMSGMLLLIDMATRPCRQRWSGSVTGWIASPVVSRCWTAGCHGCTSILYVASNDPIQLRFRTFQLQSGEYVEIRRGVKATDPLIGRFTSSHRPGRVIEVAGNKIIVVFNSSAVHHVGPAFNFTFQPKGMFLAVLAAASESLPCNYVITAYQRNLPSVLWCCWLGGRKGIWPVKTELWGAGVVICLEQGADLHMAQLMPLSLTVSCFGKIQIGFTFLLPAHLGSPWKRAVKRVCVKETCHWTVWVRTCTLSMSFKNSFTVRLSSKFVVKSSFPYFIRNQIFCKEQSSFISYSYVLSDSRDWMTAILISFIDVCLQCFDTVGWASGTPSSW